MFTILFLSILVLLDSLIGFTFWVAYNKMPSKRRKVVFWHMILSVALVAGLLLYRYALDKTSISLAYRQTVTLLFVWLYFTKLLTIIIFWKGLFISKILKRIKKTELASPTAKENMTRAKFLERVGLTTGGLSLGLGFWGTNRNLYEYQVHHVPIHLENLPTAFRGMRIAQISDIHAGSLTNKLAVKGGFELLMREKPDLICFTGDLVNYDTREVRGFEHIFSALKAPLGVFSCLGNHDYGDYRDWQSLQAKQTNLAELLQAHRDFGWKPLVDAHTYIEVQGEKMAILGVGNWSKMSRFPRYGNLSKAYQDLDKEVTTQILLSHDPTHWDAQVRPQTPKVSLTLAGHTHGMQLGMEWGKLRFSPAQLVFEQWAGLYQKNNQYLYVNRGFGYSDAFPIRLGILPEITIFTLG